MKKTTMLSVMSLLLFACNKKEDPIPESKDILTGRVYEHFITKHANNNKDVHTCLFFLKGGKVEKYRTENKEKMEGSSDTLLYTLEGDRIQLNLKLGGGESTGKIGDKKIVFTNNTSGAVLEYDQIK